MTRFKEIAKIALPALCMVVVMALIFALSSQTGEQSSQTSAAVGDIVQTLPGSRPSQSGEPFEKQPFLGGFNLRKSAHIILFFALGVTSYLWVLGMVAHFAPTRRVLRYAVPITGAGLICFLYALSDEWHQTFVDGRGASMTDVGIDSIGFCTAIAGTACIVLIVDIILAKIRIHK